MEVPGLANRRTGGPGDLWTAAMAMRGRPIVHKPPYAGLHAERRGGGVTPGAGTGRVGSVSEQRDEGTGLQLIVTGVGRPRLHRLCR